MPRSRPFEVAFSVTLVTHLVLLFIDQATLTAATKVLLLPFLMLMLGKELVNKKAIFIAMLFSWIGDVLLIQSEKPIFFMLGLGSFLIAQLSYGVGFLQRAGKSEPGLLKKQPIKVLPVVTLALLVYVRLYPGLGDMVIPVSVYVGAISFMLLAAIHRGGFAPVGNKLLVAGAMLFMLSDTILAWNRFLEPVRYADIWVMLTYGLAQYSIAKSWQLKSQD
jgi:uncharacterized membrane protein YhhN